MSQPNYSYIREKLSSAVQILATHPGRIKERVEKALGDIVAAPAHPWPSDDMRDQASRIIGPLTRVKSGPEGRGVYGNSLDAMTESEACSLALAVMSLELMLDGYLQNPPEED